MPVTHSTTPPRYRWVTEDALVLPGLGEVVSAVKLA
jgi:hypothetical protein